MINIPFHPLSPEVPSFYYFLLVLLWLCIFLAAPCCDCPAMSGMLTSGQHGWCVKIQNKPVGYNYN